MVATLNYHVMDSDNLNANTKNAGYRVFLGIVENGNYLVQDFYENGEKYTDSYQLIRQSAILNNGPDWHTGIHGPLFAYYPTGEKMLERHGDQGHFANETNTWYKSGQLAAQMRYIRTGNLYTAYYPSGQKSIEMQYNEKGQIIKRQEWDEQGNVK